MTVVQLQEAVRKLASAQDLRNEVQVVTTGRKDDIEAVRAILRLKEENKALMAYVDRLIQAFLQRDMDTLDMPTEVC